MHTYRIVHRKINSSTGHTTGLKIAKVQATNRFGALRTWWRNERQWGNLADIIAVEPVHTKQCNDPGMALIGGQHLICAAR